MSVSKLIPLLERVKVALGPCEHDKPETTGPGTQDKPSVMNKMSTSAAKAKLAELEKLQKSGRSAETTVVARGAKPAKA